MDLPKLTCELLLVVDMTPDSNLPLRILRAYRQNCDSMWEVHGFTEKQKLIYDEMNLHQIQRAMILDEAILRLENYEKTTRNER